jgi:chromate transport protein ChrA
MKRFSIIRKPHYLFYSVSVLGIFAVGIIPYFQNMFRAIWIITAPLIIGAYLQYILKNDISGFPINKKKPVWIYVIIGMLFLSVASLTITVLLVSGVI